ncbi:MAG: hypothetical protein ACYDAC_11555 [Candidatus Dormibacteria bacterium]
MDGRGRRLWAALAATTLATAAAPTVASAGPGATTSSFSTKPSNLSPNVGQDDRHALQAGDWISVGIVASNHNHKNSATALYLTGKPKAVLQYTCDQNGPSAGAFVVPLPSDALGTYPANYTANGGWWPSNQWQNSLTYQAVFQVGDVCDGDSIYLVANAETYSGTLAASPPTHDLYHVQLHTAIPAANGAANTTCTSGPGANTPACNFQQNGDQDNLTPVAQASSSPPSSAPSSNGPAAPGSPIPPSTGSSAQAQSPVAAVSSAPGSRGSGAGSTPSTTSGASALPSGSRGVSAPSAPPATGASKQLSVTAPGGVLGISIPAPPLLKGMPVIAPLAAAAGASLFGQLPLGWFALLAALDLVIATAILARRLRARGTPS